MFDPFTIRYAKNWNTVIEWFRKQVVAIDNEARHFIDDSFKTLRSAEGAFDMLLKFKHIRSREAINNQMMKKFNDILLQFGKEVGYSHAYYFQHNVNTFKKPHDLVLHKFQLYYNNNHFHKA